MVADGDGAILLSGIGDEATSCLLLGRAFLLLSPSPRVSVASTETRPVPFSACRGSETHGRELGPATGPS
jgi:hypothetical protein